MSNPAPQSLWDFTPDTHQPPTADKHYHFTVKIKVGSATLRCICRSLQLNGDLTGTGENDRSRMRTEERNPSRRQLKVIMTRPVIDAAPPEQTIERP